MKNPDWVDQGPPETPLPEQTFFDDPAIDRAFAVTMALATEVWVLKDRVMALEAALAKSGTIDPAAIAAEPDNAERAEREAERQAFVAGLLDNLTGLQASAGAPEREARMDDRSFVAAQDVILDMKKHWTTRFYPALKTQYGELADAASETPETRQQVAKLLGGTTSHRYFAWMERHLQRMKYSGRYGLVPYHRERKSDLRDGLPDMSGDARLDLNPDFQNPTYYETVDVHQHPGGVWSEATAGFAYERGARSTTPMLGTKHRDLHGRLTDRAIRDGVPDRMLDMGCGFGKSTGPFYEELRETQVEAVDLAAPCLELAAAEAAKAQAENVRFRQMSAYDTDYDPESFDLVTSTMLLHEMPPEEIGKTFDECARVLKPGGRMVHLDFYLLPDAFTEFVHYGHSRRNNEPFMVPLAEMDLEAELAARGFTNISIEAFQEADGIDIEDNPYWRFPWTIVAADRPKA